MMADEDFDFLEKVFNKLRSARNTKSSVRLNHAEIKIILKIKRILWICCVICLMMRISLVC